LLFWKNCSEIIRGLAHQTACSLFTAHLSMYVNSSIKLKVKYCYGTAHLGAKIISQDRIQLSHSYRKVPSQFKKMKFYDFS